MLLDFGLRILKGDISTDGKWCFIIFKVCLSSGEHWRARVEGTSAGGRCPCKAHPEIPGLEQEDKASRLWPFIWARRAAQSPCCWPALLPGNKHRLAPAAKHGCYSACQSQPPHVAAGPACTHRPSLSGSFCPLDVCRGAASLAAAQVPSGGHLSHRHRHAAPAVALAVGAQGTASLPAAGVRAVFGSCPTRPACCGCMLMGLESTGTCVHTTVQLPPAAPPLCASLGCAFQEFRFVPSVLRPTPCRWLATTGRACCTR